MSSRGTFAVTTMLAVALGLAAASVLYHRNQSQRILAAWGQEQLLGIRTAARVEATRLSPLPALMPDPTWPALRIGEHSWYPTAWTDISSGRGLIHLQAALAADASFDWSVAPSEPIAWTYAVRFHHAQRSVVLAVSEQGEWVALPALDSAICSRPIAAGLRDFLGERLGATAGQRP